MSSRDWPNPASEPQESHVGVCILRVEHQENYLLITVTINRHVGGSHFAQPEEKTRYANRADALAAVEKFLESFP